MSAGELGELVDPMLYSWWWLPVGVLVGLAALALVVVAWRLTRPAELPPQPEPEETAALTDSGPYAQARATAVLALNRLQAQFEAGEITTRTVHGEIRKVLRSYAAVRLGRDVSSLTVADLHTAEGTEPLGKWMEWLLAPTFAHDAHPWRPSPRKSLRLARGYVEGW